MAVREVTLQLPLEIYEQIRNAAAQAHRAVDDVLVEAVIAAAPVAGAVSVEASASMAQLAYLNDASLWQAARATLGVEQRERLADLHEKLGREPLSGSEQAEEQALLALYRGTILVRARAALLLKQRGYDILDPGQFSALE